MQLALPRQGQALVKQVPEAKLGLGYGLGVRLNPMLLEIVVGLEVPTAAHSQLHPTFQ